MKKLITWLTAACLLLSLTLIPAVAAGAGGVVYRNTQAIADNLSCTNTISWDAQTGRQSSYALNLTGVGDAYPIVLACDTIYGRLTAPQMIAYAESAGYSVLAAVNTDFFSMQTGVPLGIVIEDGTYKSSPEGHTAVSIGPDGKFSFADAAEVTMTLSNNGAPADTTNAGKMTTLSHFNKYRTDPGGLYLFSSDFSTISTRSVSDGWYVRFKILEGTPTVSGTMTLEVTEMLEATPDAQPIGDGYLLLSAGTAAGLADEYNKYKVGDRVTLTFACSDPVLAAARWATGGGDVLIKDGVMTDSSGWDKAITARNPRTAVGLKADGTVVTYVVDGHEADNSSGLTLKALAEELLALGCVQAVNLDGGGSSVISVRMPGSASSAVINKPSDGSPRKVAAYLLFVTNAVPDGRARHLGITNDGFEVLAGSSVDLSYYATDTGYMPVSVPGDIAVQSGLGSVAGATYTAGAEHGVDTLTLTSPSTGAAGTATAHIIYDPTAVTVTREDSGQPVSSLSLEVGETVQLAVSASYYNLPVHFDSDAVVFTLEGDVGTVDATGLFTAGMGGGAAGTLKVSVGGCTAEIPVKVSGFADTVDHWAKEYIKDLNEKGIVNGVTDTTFEPEWSIKRGDFVLMLHRAAGLPEAAAAATFTDVAPDDYYADAIAWAEGCGVAQGTGDGLFSPQAVLTREQAFTLVYRAFAALGIAYTDGLPETLGAFSDAASLSDYAVTPTATLIGMGIVEGSYGLLSPQDEMTRAQMAKILDVVLNLPQTGQN